MSPWLIDASIQLMNHMCNNYGTVVNTSPPPPTTNRGIYHEQY